MQKIIARTSYAAAMLAASVPVNAGAANWLQEVWDNTVFTQILRTDVALRTTSQENFYNQGHHPYHDVGVNRQAYVPPTLVPVPGEILPAADRWVVPIPGFSDTFRDSELVDKPDNDFNLVTQRYEMTAQTRFNNNWKFNIRLRAIFDPGVYESDNFRASDYANVAGGLAGGQRPDYRPSYFEARGRGGRNLNPLEISGRNYMVDLPTFFLEYKKGDMTLRLGNQTIAWGSSIFFRTLDIPNGLDFRRHLILDRAIEEFSDKRVPSFGVRLSYQFSGTVLGDFFVKKFQPTILPNPNTPYNVIPAAFYKPYDNYYTGGYDDEVDAGFRLKGDYGNWGWQFVYASRLNPLGAIRWAEAGVNKGVFGPVGEVVRLAYNAKLPMSNPVCQANYDPTICRLYGSVEEAFSHAPVHASPAGTASDLEWWATAGGVKADGLGALNSAVADFPAIRDLYGSTAFNLQEGRNELNTFFMAGGNQGGLRGFLQRDYHREDVFGVGGSVVTSSENSLLDSIILNLEVQYTPDRVFTSPDLRKQFLTRDALIASLVAEKWTRWSETYPAAYLVLQYQFRNESDLVGLSLDGYGGNDATGSEPKVPGGIGSSNYLVFAGFQPTPNRRFVFEWAVLLDVKGGLLVQPGVQYNPGGGINLELFYNYVNGSLYGDPTENVVRRIDWADEVTARFTYAF